MGDDAVDREGNVHERGWDGQYRPKQGAFGPERDTDSWGRPDSERDGWGRPKEKQDGWGRQQTSKDDAPLYERRESGGGGGGGGGSGLGGMAAIVVIALVLTVGVFLLAGWLLWNWLRLCRRYPAVMLPLTAVILSTFYSAALVGYCGGMSDCYTTNWTLPLVTIAALSMVVAAIVQRSAPLALATALGLSAASIQFGPWDNGVWLVLVAVAAGAQLGLGATFGWPPSSALARLGARLATGTLVTATYLLAWRAFFILDGPQRLAQLGYRSEFAYLEVVLAPAALLALIAPKLLGPSRASDLGDRISGWRWAAATVVVALSLTGVVYARTGGMAGPPPPTPALVAAIVPTNPPVATPTPPPTATAVPPTATVAPPRNVWVVVGNTGGEGVFIRRTPRMPDKVTAWPDGTRLQVIGPDQDNEGVHWKQVRDPKGQTGFVPAQYVTPTPGD